MCVRAYQSVSPSSHFHSFRLLLVYIRRIHLFICFRSFFFFVFVRVILYILFCYALFLPDRALRLKLARLMLCVKYQFLIESSSAPEYIIIYWFVVLVLLCHTESSENSQTDWEQVAEREREKENELQICSDTKCAHSCERRMRGVDA